MDLRGKCKRSTHLRSSSQLVLILASLSAHWNQSNISQYRVMANVPPLVF